MKRIFLFVLSVFMICFLVLSIQFSYAEDIIPYEELIILADKDSPDKSESKDTPIKVEVVIGNITDSYLGIIHFDEWIKGDKCYYLYPSSCKPKEEEYAYAHEIIPGQRIIYTLSDYEKGWFGAKYVLSYDIIEEGVDYNQFETEYKNKAFDTLSYKKIMRNIDDLKYSRVVVEGTILQDIGSEYFSRYLLVDDDLNFYYINGKGNNETKLLEKDRIRIYGKIYGTYEYLTLFGEKTVPEIIPEYLDLLEEE